MVVENLNAELGNIPGRDIDRVEALIESGLVGGHRDGKRGGCDRLVIGIPGHCGGDIAGETGVRHVKLIRYGSVHVTAS